MGILLSFLSCQKDADKPCPYLNATEKHVNDLGVPIQTCGEELIIPYGYYSSYSVPEDHPFDDIDTYGYPIDGYTFYGKFVVYNDSKYLYVKVLDDPGWYFDDDIDFEVFVYPEGVVQDTKKYTSNVNLILKIPLSDFNPNVKLIVEPKLLVDNIYLGPYIVYWNLFSPTQVPYKVFPCCETTE
ncbi:hypothetical protein D3C72_898370 [compost metagenome]